MEKIYAIKIEYMIEGVISFVMLLFHKKENALKEMEVQKKYIFKDWAKNVSKDDLEIVESDESFFVKHSYDDFYTELTLSEETFND